MSDIPKCGICDFFAGLMRRFMCVATRRGSCDTNYRELGDQETLHVEDGSSSSDSIPPNMLDLVMDAEQRRTFEEEVDELFDINDMKGLDKEKSLRRFHTCRQNRRQQRYLIGIKDELTILDDCYPKQVELLLLRSGTWEFDTHDLDRASGGHCLPVLGMHLFTGYGLIDYFKLVPEKCLKLFKSIEEHYRDNRYHNSVHAADVTQAVHCFLQQPAMRGFITPLETLVVLLAAMTHDLDHPGVNHSYLVATNHPLAIMYKDKELGVNDRSPAPRRGKRGKLLQTMIKDLAAARHDPFINIDSPKATAKSANAECSTSKKKEPPRPTKKEPPQCDSILEHHHWRVAFSCILQSGIFDHIPERLSLIRKKLKSFILATDITRQNQYLNKFREHLDRNTLDINRPEHRHMVLQMALKTADISNPGRPWTISRKWSQKVCDEFYVQGDLERDHNLKISNLCDREKDTVPRIQTGFFRYVVSPLFTQWHQFLKSDLSQKMLLNLIRNDSEWAREDIRSKTETSEIPTITDADMVLNSLESSTNLTGSSEMLIPSTPEVDTPSVGSRRRLRRSSYSPVNQSAMKDAIRRYSAPLHTFMEPRSRSRGKKEFLSERRLRQDAAAHAAPDSPVPKHNIVFKNSTNIKYTSMVEITLMVTRDRFSESEIPALRKRGNSLPAVKGSVGQEVVPLPAPGAEGETVAQLIDFTSSLRAFTVQNETEPDTDEETSSDEKRAPEQFSVVMEESSSSSASQLTGSTIPTASLIPMVSSNIASSSESRINRPLLDSEKYLLKNVASSCETITFSPKVMVVQEVDEQLAASLYRRRGSAPAPSVSELKQLATTLSLQQLTSRSKHATCIQRIAAEGLPATARRGSLPLEVMTGISA